jgi:hypothetical protein
MDVTTDQLEGHKVMACKMNYIERNQWVTVKTVKLSYPQLEKRADVALKQREEVELKRSFAVRNDPNEGKSVSHYGQSLTHFCK